MSYPYPPPPPQRQVVKRSANHGLHLTLSILTCGLWAITGWPIAAAMGRKTVTTVQPQPGAYPPPGYGPPPGQYPPQYGQQQPGPPPPASWGQPPRQ
ncbi:hypothetical protein [Kitasatospora sp. NPDC056181]|uniref:hypothetical protein n=1 Tax=Kitasatospora sp. NPDC056181 TaxID=3345737 RepID=UPI0035E0181D